MKKKTKIIPPEYKCIRCHLDIREEAPRKEKCICVKDHPVTGNKSGYGIQKVYFDYMGFTHRS